MWGWGSTPPPLCAGLGAGGCPTPLPENRGGRLRASAGRCLLSREAGRMRGDRPAVSRGGGA